jgi:hypothetical protein
MMAPAIRAILLAKATAATLVGRRAIHRPSTDASSYVLLRIADDSHGIGDEKLRKYRLPCLMLPSFVVFEAANRSCSTATRDAPT